ncbi:MAG: N-acetylmuramic acid 6-phosphate etherase [Saprospiraceae bacterium]|nr:N-acetylmuramic acid 6-phosphate etherase [Saprospiraceae bacterium]MDW8230335.1 N-acetylmuramic acid 6-phosphate etherase [Saprospiraceae bacterium]
MELVTEQSSPHRHLETLSTRELLERINSEDKTVPYAVERALAQIEALVEALVPRMAAGGRLFYIGAGTSGRLGIVDASEIPPTYGAPPGWVIGLIAGGDGAIRKAVEGAEDSETQAWEDLRAHQIDEQDFVVGIAASGTTPYVVHGLRTCRQHGIPTGCITCNPGAPVLAEADYPILVVTGPEFVTGSTRMKAGTAQKLVLNMISTTAMIRLGRVQDNKMVDMQLSNNKLIARGTRMVAHATGLDEVRARQLLLEHGSVREAIAAFKP